MDGEHDEPGPGKINPLVIGIFGIMAGALMVAAYNFVSSICCWAHDGRNDPTNNYDDDIEASVFDQQRAQSDHAAASSNITSSSSTSTSTRPANKKNLMTINEANISRYDDGSGGRGKVVDALTCAICLTDFKVGDQVRVLPECFHVFHVPCVDVWLFSHPNCPLCRATAAQATVSSTEDAGGAPVPELHPPLPHIGG